MQTIQIRLHPLGKIIQAARGSSLIDVLHEFGVEFPCGGKGTCGKCRVRVLQGEIRADPGHLRKLEELRQGPSWRLACMSTAEDDLVLEVDQYETIIQADETRFSFTPAGGYGVAVDVGTTTLVAQLVDLTTANILGVETALNPQGRWGSDLISRLESALAGQGPDLTRSIRRTVGTMLGKLVRGKSINVDRVVMVGNTVMQHLFAGDDIRPLSFYPFESPNLTARYFQAGELQWEIPFGNIVFYPSIGSFVGSDILAGIHATGMLHHREFSALVDLGTNGEIAVGNRDGLLCASTAAGPAFEGALISQGMLATTGAISSVRDSAEGLRCSVIGNVPAAGICGSGLIDAVAVLLEKGELGSFGEILSGRSYLPLTGEVHLTARDIQEFQLAKAAIAAGLQILLRKLDITWEQLSQVYISGAFGSYINLENMIRTRMMAGPADRFRKLGNSALIGAKMFLFSDMDPADGILARTNHVNLESEPDFQDLFVDRLGFSLPSS